jgi:hypothetical protein
MLQSSLSDNSPDFIIILYTSAFATAFLRVFLKYKFIDLPDIFETFYF